MRAPRWFSWCDAIKRQDQDQYEINNGNRITRPRTKTQSIETTATAAGAAVAVAAAAYSLSGQKALRGTRRRRGDEGLAQKSALFDACPHVRALTVFDNDDCHLRVATVCRHQQPTRNVTRFTACRFNRYFDGAHGAAAPHGGECNAFHLEQKK